MLKNLIRSATQLSVILIFITHTGECQDNFTAYSVKVDEPIEMIPVEGGKVNLGASDQVEVKVDSFWMGKYEISWEQYKQFSEEVMDNLNEEKLQGEAFGLAADVISLPSPPYVDMSFGMGTYGYPAISMTHYAASMFTKWLTAKTGDFYRLPTEAEWEYACKSGADEKELKAQAWYNANSERGYKKVGTKEPNEFGIYDLPGNVAEWTTDQYFENYYEKLKELGSEPIKNPWFQPTKLYPRTARGASWMDTEDQISCTKRRASSPNWKVLDPQLPKSLWWHTSAFFLGFRIVRPVQKTSYEEMKKYWPKVIEDY